VIEIFHNHERVAFITAAASARPYHHQEHMPKAHQRYGGMTPKSSITRGPARTGVSTRPRSSSG